MRYHSTRHRTDEFRRAALFHGRRSCHCRSLTMPPIALFGIQFSLALVAYLLIGFWYVRPRLARQSLAVALSALVWVHVFRVVGASILAPGSIDPAIPSAFATMVGLGDLTTAVLALVAVIALRLRLGLAIPLIVLCIGVGLVDTINAVIQSVRFDVFDYSLGVNWIIVTMYVPALLVSTLLIVLELRRPARDPAARPA